MIGAAAGVYRVAGLYVIVTADGRAVILADPTVNIDPTADELADIAIMAADRARRVRHRTSSGAHLVLELRVDPAPPVDQGGGRGGTGEVAAPDLMVDGEMMADVALQPALRDLDYPFATLSGEANVSSFQP